MIVMMAGDANSLELWSAKSHQQVIKLVKKGDFKIKCFDAKDGYIAYTDAQDT
jgi:DNA-binding transcriptional regulator/RsmH inhibitor MraZ